MITVPRSDGDLIDVEWLFYDDPEGSIPLKHFKRTMLQHFRDKPWEMRVKD